MVHHALCNVIEPIFERTFIGDSYANRVGKGTHAALDRAQALARRYRYVLQCDVEQFFPSVDLAILGGILARKIADPKVMWLADRILDGGAGVLANEYDVVYFPGDDLFAANRPRGLPIGNLTSQFWANVYLNELDQFVKRQLRCPAYLRYVDDFLLFADDKRQLWEWKDAIRERLADLRLTMHERESTVYPVTTGMPFLGFRVYPDHRRLKRRNGVAFARRLRGWRRQVARGKLTQAELTPRVQGWAAHAAHGDTWGLRRALLTHAMKQSPIFTRTYDLLRWLLPMTVKFPRQQRFVLAVKVQRVALQFQDEIIEAAYSAEPLAMLKQADVTLTRLRLYLRLCRDLELLTPNQHAHVTRMVSEVGRLLGGWQKSFTEKPQP